MHPTPDDRRTEDRTDAAVRRTRVRLRELCDEVLASHRVANGADPVTPDDRAAASAVLGAVTPTLTERPAR